MENRYSIIHTNSIIIKITSFVVIEHQFSLRMSCITIVTSKKYARDMIIFKAVFLISFFIVCKDNNFSANKCGFPQKFTEISQIHSNFIKYGKKLRPKLRFRCAPYKARTPTHAKKARFCGIFKKGL